MSHYLLCCFAFGTVGEELSGLQARVVQTAVYVDRQTVAMGSFKETPALCPGNHFKGLSVEFPFCFVFCFFSSF